MSLIEEEVNKIAQRYNSDLIAELSDEITTLTRERDQFKAGHIRYRRLYREECDRVDTLVIKFDNLTTEHAALKKAHLACLELAILLTE